MTVSDMNHLFLFVVCLVCLSLMRCEDSKKCDTENTEPIKDISVILILRFKMLLNYKTVLYDLFLWPTSLLLLSGAVTSYRLRTPIYNALIMISKSEVRSCHTDENPHDDVGP